MIKENEKEGKKGMEEKKEKQAPKDEGIIDFNMIAKEKIKACIGIAKSNIGNELLEDIISIIYKYLKVFEEKCKYKYIESKFLNVKGLEELEKMGRKDIVNNLKGHIREIVNTIYKSRELRKEDEEKILENSNFKEFIQEINMEVYFDTETLKKKAYEILDYIENVSYEEKALEVRILLRYLNIINMKIIAKEKYGEKGEK